MKYGMFMVGLFVCSMAFARTGEVVKSNTVKNQTATSSIPEWRGNICYDTQGVVPFSEVRKKCPPRRDYSQVEQDYKSQDAALFDNCSGCRLLKDLVARERCIAKECSGGILKPLAN